MKNPAASSEKSDKRKDLRVAQAIIYNRGMISGFKRRISIFFILLGVVVLALFFTSDVVEKPNIGYLFWGIIFIILGAKFLRSSHPEPEESQRFRLFRKIFSRKKKEEEEEL